MYHAKKKLESSEEKDPISAVFSRVQFSGKTVYRVHVVLERGL